MASGDFPSTLKGNNDSEKLQNLCSYAYKFQAVWYLNAFWGNGMKDQAEKLWEFVDKASQIDNAKADGNGLDELEAHRFLEAFHDAHTVLELRSKLRKTGAIGQNERPKTVPLAHYLLFTYDHDWKALVNSAQGDNSDEIAEAQRMLQAVQAAYDEVDARLADAKAREEEAREAEAPFKQACEELEAARKALQEQEEAYNAKTAQLKEASETGGVVSRNRAKVQLDAHLAEDPLPLRKAKLTMEASQKKADKARAPFQEKTDAAAAARAQVEVALEEARNRMKEAEDFLDAARNKPGCAHGSLWWIDRELHEKKKYMPTAKGGIRK
jgi:DNA repair exonuclease SbcCD ATPase subunit